MDSEFLDAVRYDSLRGPEKPGCLSHVPARILERVDEQLPFKMSHRVLERKRGEGAGFHSGLEGRGEMGAVDDMIIGQEDRSLHAVLELPHISRPVVLNKRVDRRG